MKKYWVWLSSLDMVSPSSRLKLLDYFKEPANIWDAPGKELGELRFLPGAAIKQITSREYRDEVSRHMENISRMGIEIITIRDDNYPLFLGRIYDPPVALYAKGILMREEKSIAIVGSRKATSYGSEIAEELAYKLASYGLTVVSGMARGIDSCAHKGALAAKGRTIAVLGCGHDIVYPSENKSLMEDIIKSGAVISEYLPEAVPLPRNFPARNRIISGLSLGVVVVEAAKNSGSLITANFALEQGREVFALPGDINRVNSQGTNKLIQDGAKLVTCVEDILEELRIYNIIDEAKLNGLKSKYQYHGFDKREIYGNLSDDEWCIVENLMHEPMHVDVLVKMTGYDVKEVNYILTMLELKGVVEQVQGRVYKLRRQKA